VLMVAGEAGGLVATVNMNTEPGNMNFKVERNR
jgi:hypothetical protein